MRRRPWLHAPRSPDQGNDLRARTHPSSLQDPVVTTPPDTAARHARPHIPLEPLPVPRQILGRLLVERIASVGLEEQELQPHDDGVEIEHRLPVLAQNIQTNIAFEVDVWVVDFLRALDLWRLVRKVLRNDKGEVEDAAFVHAFVGRYGQREVQNVVWIGKVRLHRAAEREFREVCKGDFTTSVAVFLPRGLP